MQTGRSVVHEAKPLSTGEVARLLHVTSVAVLRWIRAGKLPAYRVPRGRYRIPRPEFLKFLADNRIPLTLEAPRPRRVLVVDDEAPVRESLQAALEVKGYEVVLAKDGREALRIVRQDDFDLIFLDVLLPSVSGGSVLRAIKRRSPETIVVLITGFPQHDETLAALEFGPAMLLPKPFRLGDLDTVLKIVFKG
jgi:excisionase family DNA binding protein